jgi:hypothetical protein
MNEFMASENRSRELSGLSGFAIVSTLDNKMGQGLAHIRLAHFRLAITRRYPTNDGLLTRRQERVLAKRRGRVARHRIGRIRPCRAGRYLGCDTELTTWSIKRVLCLLHALLPLCRRLCALLLPHSHHRHYPNRSNQR